MLVYVVLTVVPPPPPPADPLADFDLLQQHFDALLMAAGADQGADVGPTTSLPKPLSELADIAPIFFRSPRNLSQIYPPLFNGQAKEAEYYEALQWCTDKGYLVTDDSIRLIPIDPLVALVYSSSALNYSQLHKQSNQVFGEFQSSAVSMIMRTSAFHNFTQEVDRYAETCPVMTDLAKVATLAQGKVTRPQPRLLVMGPQGMGKSYSMLYDVTLKRSTDTNRVIFIPDCGQWASNSGGPLVYLIDCISIAFRLDPPVVAACHQVFLATRRDQSAESSREMVTNLLTFLAMYCQLHRLRLYLYADQLNELEEERLYVNASAVDHSRQFPFSILSSTFVPYWSALGVVVITATSANYNILNEVSPSHHITSQRECNDVIFLVRLVITHLTIMPPCVCVITSCLSM